MRRRHVTHGYSAQGAADHGAHCVDSSPERSAGGDPQAKPDLITGAPVPRARARHGAGRNPACNRSSARAASARVTLHCKGSRVRQAGTLAASPGWACSSQQTQRCSTRSACRSRTSKQARHTTCAQCWGRTCPATRRTSARRLSRTRPCTSSSRARAARASSCYGAHPPPPPPPPVLSGHAASLSPY